jgi:hypothetical protein
MRGRALPASSHTPACIQATVSLAPLLGRRYPGRRDVTTDQRASTQEVRRPPTEAAYFHRMEARASKPVAVATVVRIKTVRWLGICHPFAFGHKHRPRPMRGRAFAG